MISLFLYSQKVRAHTIEVYGALARRLDAERKPTLNSKIDSQMVDLNVVGQFSRHPTLFYPFQRRVGRFVQPLGSSGRARYYRAYCGAISINIFIYLLYP